jgi:glucose-6-phosphate 1-epimerase
VQSAACSGRLPAALKQRMLVVTCADGPLPAHGFARTSAWTLESNADGRAVLRLSSSSATRALWDHAFELNYEVVVTAKALRTRLSYERLAWVCAALSAIAHMICVLCAVPQRLQHGHDGIHVSSAAAHVPGMPSHRSC